jgi:transcriptional regulator with XRE-family HTH domain
MLEEDPRRALGAFLRAHRERIRPATTGGRRRTPGLRREELAQACGVSVTWITWLEQGRDVSASPAVLEKLAEALHLSAAERASLFDLAGKRDPAGPAEPASALPASVLQLPSLLTVPAYVLDHSWTARAWNRAAARLFTGWLDEAATDRNLLRFALLSPASRTLLAEWPERVRRLVAEFRADYSRRPRDPAIRALVDELSVASAPFRTIWQKQQVLHREGGERSFRHPLEGRRRFLQTTLLVASHPECKLVCLAPLDAPARTGRGNPSARRGSRPSRSP